MRRTVESCPLCLRLKKVGTTFPRRIFSLINHIAKICLSLASREQIRLVENGL
jgi:hypothetical protein